MELVFEEMKFSWTTMTKNSIPNSWAVSPAVNLSLNFKLIPLYDSKIVRVVGSCKQKDFQIQTFFGRKNPMVGKIHRVINETTNTVQVANRK